MHPMRYLVKDIQRSIDFYTQRIGFLQRVSS